MSDPSPLIRLGLAAAGLVEDHMTVGLGTGRAASALIEALGLRCRQESLDIVTVASSESSAALAKKCGLRVVDLNEVGKVDLSFDGADEIDSQKQMIKGGGGALLREKILASNSTEMIVLVGEEKLVERLGAFLLPVEIVPYGSVLTRKKIESFGFKTAWRKQADGYFFITDNQNLILDVQLTEALGPVLKIEEQLISVAGVVETGFFFNLAGRVVVLYHSGRVKILKNFIE